MKTIQAIKTYFTLGEEAYNAIKRWKDELLQARLIKLFSSEYFKNMESANQKSVYKILSIEATSDDIQEQSKVLDNVFELIKDKNLHEKTFFANYLRLIMDNPNFDVTTAYDLALITSYAMQNEIFKEIVSTKNIKITNSDGKVRYLKNKNKLLTSLDGCNGVKTGFTDDAGRCYVGSCEREGMTIVCVVLNCGPMFEECGALINKAFDEYHLIDLTSGYAYDDKIKIIEGEKDFVKIGTKGEYLYPLRIDEFKKVSYVYDISNSIQSPITKGSEVGEIKIFIDNKLHFSEKVFTMENVRRNSIWQKIKDLIEQW